MIGRAVVLVSLVAIAQPAEARPKAKARPAPSAAFDPSLAVTYTKPAAPDAGRWRMKRVSHDALPPPPIEWRFTGSRMKMRVAF